MKLKTALVTLTLIGGAAMAGDCPHEYKPPTKHKVPPKAPPKKTPPKVTPPAPTPCSCKGEQGPPGEPGITTEKVVLIVKREKTTVYTAALTPRLGVMGFIALPAQDGRRGDWAWGAALQLEFQIGKRDFFAIDGGLAAPFNIDGSPGRQSGYLLHAGESHFFNDGDHLGLTAGVHYTSITGDSTNGDVSARYLGLDFGLVYKRDLGPINLRAELTPVIGGLRDTYSKDDTQFSAGLAGSLFVGVNL